jgi:hypothetical protein
MSSSCQTFGVGRHVKLLTQRSEGRQAAESCDQGARSIAMRFPVRRTGLTCT